MKHQIATNTSQSARLIACGVEISTADMYLEKSNVPPVDYHLHTIAEGIDHAHWFKYRGNRDIIPAWSLSALLALLPQEISYPELQPYLKIEQCSRFGWSVSYYDYYMDDIAHEVRGFGLIESCVIMIEWLTQNGYKLNEIKYETS